MHVKRFNLHKTNAANEELVISLKCGREVQERIRYTNCSYHSNSLSNKMDNFLLDAGDINHIYIVVVRMKKPIVKIAHFCDRFHFYFYVTCFLQVLFGQSCKTFLDIVACPNWTKLQSLGWLRINQPKAIADII